MFSASFLHSGFSYSQEVLDEHPVWSQGVVSVLALEKVIVLSPVKWHNYGGLDKFDFIKGKEFI